MKVSKSSIALMLKHIVIIFMSVVLQQEAGVNSELISYVVPFVGDVVEKIVGNMPSSSKKSIVSDAKKLVKAIIEDKVNGVFEIDSAITDKEKLYQDCLESVFEILNTRNIENNEDFFECFKDALCKNKVYIKDGNENDTNNLKKLTCSFFLGIKNAVDTSESIRSVVMLNSIQDIYKEIKQIKTELDEKQFSYCIREKISGEDIYHAVVEYNKKIKLSDEIKLEFLSDIQLEDTHFYAFDKKQPLISLLDSVWENNGAARNVVITADGGMGKTSAFYLAVRTINEDYIKDFEKNKSLTQNPIAVYIPCFDFEKEGLDGQTLTIDKAICDALNIKNEYGYFDDKNFLKRFLDLLNSNRLIVFFDGYNELIEKVRSKFETDISKLDCFDKMQIVLSSRILPKAVEGYARSKMTGISEDRILEKIEKQTFEGFSSAMKDLMSFPMFLRLYINNTDKDVKCISDLLDADRLTTYEKIAENLADGYENLRDAGVTEDSLMCVITPQVFHDLYTKKKHSMIFREKEFVDALMNAKKELSNKDARDILDLLKRYSLVEYLQKTHNYKYKHEHIRDFYVAYYIYHMIELCAADVTEVDMEEKNEAKETLSRLVKNNYAPTVLRFASEICHNYDYIPQFDGSKWMTASYCGKMKSQKAQYEMRHNPEVVSFILEIMKATFDGHNTAVGICHTVGENCFSFSNTELILSSLDGFEVKGVFPYDEKLSGYIIKTYCKLDEDKLVILYEKEGSERASIITVWDLSKIDEHEQYSQYTEINIENISSEIMDISLIENKLFVALADGSIITGGIGGSNGFAHEELCGALSKCTVEQNWIIAVTEKYIYQFCNNTVYAFANRKRTPICELPDGESLDDMCYNDMKHILLLFISHGNEKIIKQIHKNNHCINHNETIVLNDIDSKICYSAAYEDKVFACDIKGNLYLFDAQESYFCFNAEKSKKLKMHKAETRAICFNDEITFITACVDRTLRMCNYAGDVLFKLEGKNAGLRKLYFDGKDDIIATSYDRGILCIHKDEDNKYKCVNKFFSNGRMGWNWCVEKIDDSVFAVGNDDGEIVLINIRTGYESLRHDTGIVDKVETLLYCNGVLYACIGSKLIAYKVNAENDNYSLVSKFEKVFADNERPLALCKTKTGIYLGTQKKNHPYMYKVDFDYTIRLLSDFENYDGWCRDIKVLGIGDGEYALISAVSRKDANKVKQVSLLCKIYADKIDILYELQGHENLIIRGDWIYHEQSDTVRMATVSNDTRVLKYSVRLSDLISKKASPQYLDAEVLSDKLGGIVTDLKFVDFDTIIISCLNGGLYQMGFREKDAILLYKNTYGLFVNGLDFSDSNIQSASLKEILKSNDNLVE